MSMHALNRDLKNEMDVECARVVERGKGSGSGGGVFGPATREREGYFFLFHFWFVTYL